MQDLKHADKFCHPPNHERSQTCQRMGVKLKQHLNAEVATRALEETFTVYGVELERVQVFKYIGRYLSYIDSNALTIQRTSAKRGQYGVGSCGYCGRRMPPRRYVRWFTVQAVPLLGSETWVLTPLLLCSLDGFHVRAARCMTGMMPRRKPDRSWVYPNSKKVLKAAGLRTIEHYVGVRRATILRYISKRRIYKLCMEASRRRVTGKRSTGLSSRWIWRRVRRALLRQRRTVGWIFSSQ